MLDNGYGPDVPFESSKNNSSKKEKVTEIVYAIKNYINAIVSDSNRSPDDLMFESCEFEARKSLEEILEKYLF